HTKHLTIVYSRRLFYMKNKKEPAYAGSKGGLGGEIFNTLEGG
ncbi:MAG: hypothetical protein XD49_1788, partial [Caldanaerobacter subterraneus]